MACQAYEFFVASSTVLFHLSLTTPISRCLESHVRLIAVLLKIRWRNAVISLDCIYILIHICFPRFLADQTRDVRQEALLLKLMSEGQPPQPPIFSALDVTARGASIPLEGNDFDPCTMLELHWGSPRGDLVSFYQVEYAGPMGGIILGEHYKVRACVRRMMQLQAVEA